MPHLRRVHPLLHLPPVSRRLTRCTHSTNTAAGLAKSASANVESQAKANLNPYKAWWCFPPNEALTQSFPVVRVNEQHPQKRDKQDSPEMKMDSCAFSWLIWWQMYDHVLVLIFFRSCSSFRYCVSPLVFASTSSCSDFPLLLLSPLSLS